MRLLLYGNRRAGRHENRADIKRDKSKAWRRINTRGKRHRKIHRGEGVGGAFAVTKRVLECKFGCDPEEEAQLCAQCRDRIVSGPLLYHECAMQVVDLPVSATEDRVVGSLDIEHAIKTGEKKFEPGILAKANRSILYVDEVNLLDDHVVDVLLDSAA